MASFYLKYRPQKVDHLDLTSVREFFQRILQSGKVAHAYLFTGPRGTGKTSAARILAKIVNCERNKKQETRSKKQGLQEPCNKCRSCKAITNGSLMDLVEIDAASNRGIDDIRDLREKIRLAPVDAVYKVYIIDEVHMLTMEAFNALLKTLEEPPEHAVFVLATTEAHKLPETILSRCVRLNFPGATEKEVVRSLRKVVKGEKLKLESGVLELVASGVEGSFREGMKLLEQLSLKKGKVTLADAKRELGKSEGVLPQKFLEFLAGGDLSKCVAELDRLEALGVNWQVWLKDLVEALRMLLLEKIGVKIDRAPRFSKRLKELSQEQLLKLVDLASDASGRLRSLPLPQLVFEIMAVDWCSQRQSRQNPKPKTQNPKMSSVAKEQVLDSKAASVSRSDTDRTGSSEVSEIRRAGGAGMAKSKLSVEQIERKWAEVLELVKPKNHSVEGLLRSTRPKSVAGNRLKVEVFYQFHLDQLKQERYLKMVEDCVGVVFQSPLRLEYFLGSKKSRQELAEVENIAGGVEDDDIIKVAEEIFGAD